MGEASGDAAGDAGGDAAGGAAGDAVGDAGGDAAGGASDDAAGDAAGGAAGSHRTGTPPNKKIISGTPYSMIKDHFGHSLFHKIFQAYSFKPPEPRLKGLSPRLIF